MGMEKDSSDRLFPFNLDLLVRQRLGRILAFTTLLIGLAPMAIVGTLCYQTVHQHLDQQVRRQLLMAAELKASQLGRLYNDWKADHLEQGREFSPGPFFARVNQMLETSADQQAGLQTYLLDGNRQVLAGSPAGLQTGADQAVDSAQTQLWLSRRPDGISDGEPATPFIYRGPGSMQVMGTHIPILVDDIPYALFLEIEVSAAFDVIRRLQLIVLTVAALAIVAALTGAVAIMRRIVMPVHALSRRLSAVVKGRLGKNGLETADLAEFVDILVGQINTLETRYEGQSRFIADLTRLHGLIGGEKNVEELCLNALEFLSGALDLDQADFFITSDAGELECACRFPGHPNLETHQARCGKAGSDNRLLVGQKVAIFNKDAASGQIRPIAPDESGNLIMLPLVSRKAVIGILELEKASLFSRSDCRFAQTSTKIIAVALRAAFDWQQEAALRRQTREQAKQIQTRETALENNARAFMEQTQAFQSSEEKLHIKQLELEAANAQMVKNAADLEAHMAILEKQKRDMQRQNAELAETHRELAEKARQLEVSSRYKTEFMANMSHELRTPLNSVLLLSRLLMEDKEMTLTPRQSEFARTVHSAGEDLLNLINEILDLAKVESGKMEVNLEPVEIRAITRTMRESFAPLAEQRGIAFSIHVDPGVPHELVSDRKRIEQIVKNFLSNAFKFTRRGSVALEITAMPELDVGGNTGDAGESNCLAIGVVDTGIGIPAAKHEMVFEAFQQIDGSTRRKYGGTGLGLSISRELAHMLGGKITLDSKDGQGSRFTLILPILPPVQRLPDMIRSDAPRQVSIRASEPQRAPEEAEVHAGSEPVPDDRNRLIPGDTCVLIIDAEQPSTAHIKAHAHRYGYKVLVAEQFTTGLHFADYYLPTLIFLNLQLPDGSGWKMVSRMKANPTNRHIPIFTLSANDDTFVAVAHGAAGHLNTPLASSDLEAAFEHVEHLRSSNDRHILVMDSDPDRRARITDALSGPTIHTLVATTAAEAMEALTAYTVHAIIVHPSVDAGQQRSLFTYLKHQPIPLFQYPEAPTVASTRKNPVAEAMAATCTVIQTPDQLLIALIAVLHLPPESLDSVHRDRLQALDDRRHVLKGRTILLVDDDMRTVFAISNALEDQDVTVITGKTGKESLDKLIRFPDIDLVLMDVMITDVNGYQAIGAIRNRARYKNLPIIALTAKAMQGDRAKCIQAGANDYLAKPVNLDKLVSMLKIWLGPPIA
jgi:signal transduction histidine kinase/CheY-like chemotaxis protein